MRYADYGIRIRCYVDQATTVAVGKHIASPPDERKLSGPAGGL
jgi:hypothetical protein